MYYAIRYRYVPEGNFVLVIFSFVRHTKHFYSQQRKEWNTGLEVSK